MLFKLVGVIFTSINFIYSTEYPYRDISQPIYPLPNNTRILQCSPPRTGSTLVYNMLQFLFEDQIGYHLQNTQKKIIKTHNVKFIDMLDAKISDIYYVITIRNPLNVLASYLRIEEKDIQNISFEKIVYYSNMIKSVYHAHYSLLLNCKKQLVSEVKQPCFRVNDILVMKYEEFENNYEYIYKNLEIFFDIDISRENRELMNKFFNINAMKELSTHYIDFDACHPTLGIHGNHINNANWLSDIPVQYHSFLIYEFDEILKWFDY